MSDEKKKAGVQETKATAAELLSLLKALPETEKAKARQYGIAVPQIAEGSDPTKRLYGYLCRNCGKLGLHFLGDKWEIRAADGHIETITEIPSGVPFDRLAYTQDIDDPAAIYRTVHPRKPRCMYCNHELAIGPGGGIRGGYVVVREPWEKAIAKEFGSRRVRLRNFEREYQELFVQNTTPSPRLQGALGQPIIGPTPR